MVTVGAGREPASVALGQRWTQWLLYLPAVPVSGE
jgi:hypothetical protein